MVKHSFALFVCCWIALAAIAATAAEPPTTDEAPPAPSTEIKVTDEAPPAPPAKKKAEVQPQAGDKNSQAGQKYDLHYKFSPGDVIRTEVVHRATVQTTIQGTSQTAETLSKSIKRWVIGDVTDGQVTFTHSVESIDMWQKTQGRSEVRYNSETDTEVPPGYEEAAASVGIPLTVITMSDRGEVLKRQEKRAQPAALSTQITIPLPDHPVAIDESWSTPMDIQVALSNGGMKTIKTRQKFTLEKVAHDVATIAVDTQILTPIHEPAIEAQLIQRLSSGHVRFDIAAGRVINQQLDLDRRVIGFSGPSSSMHYLTRFTEKTLDDEASVAAKPSEAKPAAKDANKKSAAKKKTTKRG